MFWSLLPRIKRGATDYTVQARFTGSESGENVTPWGETELTPHHKAVDNAPLRKYCRYSPTQCGQVAVVDKRSFGQATER